LRLQDCRYGAEGRLAVRNPIWLFAVVVLLLAPSSGLPTDDDQAENFLPIGLTDEELLRLDEIGISHVGTAPPSGIIRNPAEWEPSQGVIIRYPLGLPYNLIAEMSENLMVTTIVGSSSQQSSVSSSYAANGVNMTNTNFIIAPTNSIWTRDYGPWFIFEEDGRMAVVDHIYNRPRPYDDLIPGVIGSQWGLNVYGMDLVHTGGNHMSDGLGMSMSTSLVYSENSNKTNDQVDSIMQAYLGNDYTVLYYIETGGIHHIDCWAKFLNPTTILVKDVSPSDASYELLNSRADQLAQQISAWGQPYTVVRIYSPYPTAYTNSIILNDKVLVPLFNSGYDDDALQAYRDAMPGYEVLGFYGSWHSNDAVHCRAMGVPDSGMLFIDHVPLSTQGDIFNDYTVSARIVEHSEAGLIADSLKVFYSVDGGPYSFSLLVSSVQPDSFCGYIPAQHDGAEIAYYLQAADSSGRVETHPYTGEPWAHRFNVVYTGPEITSPDSFSCKSGAEFAFYPQFTGIDYGSLAIAYSDYPVWLSVANDSLIGIPPAGNYLTGFTVEVSDQYASVDQEVALVVYLCGDIDASGAWPPDIADLVFLVDYMFWQGPPPPVEDAANVDGLDTITITDLVHLVDYMFNGGPAPVCP